MGNKVEDHQVSFTSGHGWTISRKVGYILLFLAVASCVVVGLLAYYIGVDGYQCQTLDGKPTDLQNSASHKTKITDVRLPRHLKPIKYKVDLVPFIIPGNFTIKGHVDIIMMCEVGGTTNVTLHVNDMTLDNDTITLVDLESGSEIRIIQHRYDDDRQFYIAQLDRSLQVGKTYNISINFKAKLNDQLKGFYRSYYTDKSTDKKEYIAVTQFQATDARRAFPCFDEPEFKAKFETCLGRTKDMKSISNMPIRQNGAPMEGTDEYVWDCFEESVPMSTYLVAFLISKFEFKLGPKTDNNVQFRIWARKDAVDQIQYAKDLGPKILAFFENYFNVKYPLPKQDMAAIPDFAAGAMENWGLITYRETALLFKEGVSALNNKQRIAVVISHELAHQWFGNLVTPSWWTDLWLNEGFATYVEYLGVDAVEPGMKIMEQFAYSDLQNVFGIDALETSHPISIPVKHPDEISEIFDAISYKKGASIIRMMDKFLTTQSFRKGLTSYLNDLKYQAAEQDDLWDHLTKQSHKDNTLAPDMTVKEVMDTWTLQMGFPVVTVTRNYEKNAAELKQDRFLLARLNERKEVEDDDHEYRWWIPITFTTPGGNFNNTYNSIWMKAADKVKKISKMPDKNTPVIFNIQQTGYYRVNYDKKNWEMIIETLKKDHNSIHVINRAQIIDDALNLARAGLLDYNLALGVTEYLKDESEYIPWAAALINLGFIDTMLKRTEAYGDFKRYMKKLVVPLYNRLGFLQRDNDGHLDIYLRRLAVTWACKMDHSECIDEVKGQYRSWMDKLNPDEENPVDVNMKTSVYCHALGNGDEKEWEFAWERYKNSNVGSEKNKLLRAMACTKEIWLVNRYLNMSLYPDSGIRKQDAPGVISSIASTTFGRDLAFDFVRGKWDIISENYGSATFSFSRIIKNVMKGRNTKFGLKELEDFYEERKDNFGSGSRAAKQALEKAKVNIAWMDSYFQVVFHWLKAFIIQEKKMT